jgi:hypothetical protein
MAYRTEYFQERAAERTNKGLCIRCGNPAMPQKKYCSACKEKLSIYYKNLPNERKDMIRKRQKAFEDANRYHLELKKQTMVHYGGKCACCGESELVFLTLDHIDNNGNEHRVFLGNQGGVNFYRKMRQQGFPPGLQVLCWNCNEAKQILGYCPHQREAH